MYRTVIFDLDGTLLDTIGDLAAAANAVCRENGWPEYTVQAVEGMVGHGIPNLVSRFSPAEAQEPQTLERTLAQFNRYYGAHNMELTAPYAGMPELLKKLKAAGVRLAVCSNKADEFSQVIVAHYFPGIFEVIRGNLPGTPVKPDPGVARGILEKLNARPEETLMVGDRLYTDIAVAVNAGAQSVLVMSGETDEAILRASDVQPKYVLRDVAELAQILRDGTV